MNVIKGKGPIIDPGVCRCCGVVKKCRILNVEYLGLGRKEIYSEMFVECFGLVLSHLDSEAEDRLICATCVTRLRDACCFRQQVLKCEEKLLRSRIQVHPGPDKNSDIKSVMPFEANNFFFENNDEGVMSDRNNEMEPLPEIPNVNECIDSEEKLHVTNTTKVNENLNLKSQMEILMKRNRMKMNQLKTKRMKAVKDPPDNIATDEFPNDKSLQNLITIVENSYVCPFNTFFNNYYCFYCRQKFIDCEKLRQHTTTHDPITYKEILLNSIRRRNKICQIDLYRIDCRLCDENIDNIDSFKYHVSIIHGKTMHLINDDFLKFRLTTMNLKCTECERVFGYFHLLKKHMAEHFGTCICDVCGAHYFEERTLLAHMKSHQPSDEKFPCKRCGKVFKSKYNLCIHTARLHTYESAYLCSRCDATFFSDTLRYRHMIDAHGEESAYKCEHCDKVYESKKTLRDHNRRIHLKLLKHQCSLCEKRFYLPCRLREHMSIHTGERNFKCEHCGKSYPRLRALKVHLLSHVREKKYKCTMCSASYSQNVCLKNHIKRQHQRLESEESFQG